MGPLLWPLARAQPLSRPEPPTLQSWLAHMGSTKVGHGSDGKWTTPVSTLCFSEPSWLPTADHLLLWLRWLIFSWQSAPQSHFAAFLPCLLIQPPTWISFASKLLPLGAWLPPLGSLIDSSGPGLAQQELRSSDQHLSKTLGLVLPNGSTDVCPDKMSWNNTHHKNSADFWRRDPHC